MIPALFNTTSLHFFTYTLPYVVLFIAGFWDFKRFRGPLQMLLVVLIAVVVSMMVGLVKPLFAAGTPTSLLVPVIAAIIMCISGRFLVRVSTQIYVYLLVIMMLCALLLAGLQHYFDLYLGSLHILDEQVISVFTYGSVIILVSILLVFIRRFIRSELVEYGDSPIWVSMSIAPTFAAAAMLLYYYNLIFRQGDISAWVIILYVLLIGSLLSMSIVSMRLVVRSIRGAESQRSLELADQVLDSQKTQYRLMADSIEATRRARHDMRHQLAIIDGLVQEGSYDKLRDYLAEYRTTLPLEGERVYCGNQVVNALFEEYGQRAEEGSVNFDVSLDIPDDCGISDIELIVLFGNCLENAFEATLELEPPLRSVTVRTTRRQSMLNIVIRNTYGTDLRIRNGRYLSSKRDYRSRGIGLMSVSHIVEEHDGISKIETDGRVFTFSAMINLTTSKADEPTAS